ncbi:MAG: cyclophilin-like fold protein [Acidaminococcus sp.]|jgi:hypothetical protein|nr:cyclophilin-like fold protein [Acidaminococcus sp.]MCI2115348.1 cyclophilin-like fold protein [Acidaminococcus sp.]MCI2117426.1 cyclophilin-like fold protein [Acidaminococcus sp.]
MKIKIAAAAILLSLVVSACGNSSTKAAVSNQAATSSQNVISSEESVNMKQTTKRVASDGAEMQTKDKSIATRIPPKNGTKINIRFGNDVVIKGVLNDSDTAKALIKKLPYTVHMSRYSHDFCGVTDKLPYHEEEVHYGWLNGDIDYAIDAPYFTILFKDEKQSEQYGYQVNIGVITSPIADIDALSGSYDVTVELDK